MKLQRNRQKLKQHRKNWHSPRLKGRAVRADEKRIQFLYESGGDNGWAALLLEGKDLSSILNQAEYTQKLYKYDRECLQEYMDLVQQVTDYSNQLADEKADLEASEAEQEAQQQSLEAMLEQKKPFPMTTKTRSQT